MSYFGYYQIEYLEDRNKLVELSEDNIKLVDNLIKTQETSPREVVIEDLLVLWNWAVQEAHNGFMIAAVNEKYTVYKEIPNSIREALLNA